MEIITEEEILRELTFPEAISAMKNCFRDFEQQAVSQWQRAVLPLPDQKQGNLFALMPAYLGPNRVYGAKIMSFFPENGTLQLPTHLGQILLLDSQNGAPLTLMDANSITWIRTAAVSAVATNYLAKKEATKLSLIGAGHQASSHLQAMLAIRPIHTVFVYDLDKRKLANFVESVKKTYPQLQVIACKHLMEATRETDIICTLTPSKQAFLDKDMVSPGTHINAIGTFTPETRELTSDLVASASVYVDDYQAALQESGDLLIPIAEQSFHPAAIKGSLGELVTHKCHGRETKQECTVFDAVGLAVEDLYCAEYVYNKRKGVGK